MRTRLTTRIGGSGAAAALMLGGAWLWVSVPAVAAPTTEEFEFTGGPQTFVVPDNVCQITVDALGAQGGSGGPNVAPAGEGALGGRATAALTVTPGEILQVVVGGQGGDGTGPATQSAETGGPGESVRFGNGGAGGAGGFNGGGEGGISTDPEENPKGGGGGGGASDVRRGGSRLVVAGGGGGGGVGDDDETIPGGDGGGGGGLTGEDGNPADSTDPPGSEGGKGGTPTAGGDGGGGGSPGENGSEGQGGAGAPGDEEGGGGGGGGLFGGGGGAGDFDQNPVDPNFAGGGKSVRVGLNGFANSEGAGGGGGGSGFGPAAAAFETGVREGDGVVTITYDPEAGGCPPAPQPAVVVVVQPRFTG